MTCSTDLPPTPAIHYAPNPSFPPGNFSVAIFNNLSWRKKLGGKKKNFSKEPFDQAFFPKSIRHLSDAYGDCFSFHKALWVTVVHNVSHVRTNFRYVRWKKQKSQHSQLYINIWPPANQPSAHSKLYALTRVAA